jgi:hypothetical protein
MKGESMCLYNVQSPEKKSGIGWKLVYAGHPSNGDTIYLPEYPAFHKDGSGGCGYESSGAKYRHKSPRYRIGVTYKVKHQNKAMDCFGTPYRAGVHLYTAKPEYVPGMRILECSYDNAVAEDSEGIVVALTITPLLDVTED